MFKTILLFLKETSNFIHFFWKTPIPEKTIVFYAEHEGYYSYLEGLIDKLTGQHEQSLTYITSDPDDPVLVSVNIKIKPFYLKKLLPIFMSFVNCKVYVMTMTDLNMPLQKRSVNPVHYVYAFHSLVSTHMVYRYGAFDHYDSILCVGPYQLEEITKHEKLNNLGGKILVKAGYYRLERVHKAYQEYSKTESPIPESKKTILVAPSWGEKNILESCGMELVEILLGAGFKVIVRPHPETIRRSPKVIRSIRSRFGKNPDFTYEASVATDDSLLSSDVLICDHSGIALEYAFGTERPVLFLDVPHKVRNSRHEELGITPFELAIRSDIGIIHPPNKLDMIAGIINDLILEKESYKDKIIELRKKYIYAFGESSKIGARYIMDIMEGDEAMSPAGAGKKEKVQ